MSYLKLGYILSIFVVGFGGAVAAIMSTEIDMLPITVAHLALAVLTFPLGFIAAAAGYLGLLLGLVTPTEALAVVTPFHALLGYVQWWRLLPRLYRRTG